MQLSTVIILFASAVSACAAGYTTYIGDANPYQVAAMTTDANGNTYVAGSRAVIIPAPNEPPSTDIFVSKLDSSGNATLLATLSGKGSDQARGIALDASGNIYIVGSTTSTDFPLHHPLQSVGGEFGPTGILVKLSADGTVQFSTYLGGSNGSSFLNAVAVDAKGDLYVTGETSSQDYPRTPGLPAGLVGGGKVSGAFFAKITSTGDRILYAGVLSSTSHACGVGSSCFTSSISTSGTAIAVDPMGNAYIAGNTGGLGLPATAGALQTQGIGAFVAKVNSAGTDLDYLTLLGTANYIPGGVAPGSSPGNFVYAIAVDTAGDAYIAGSTSDPAFPVTASAFQTKLSLPSTPPVSPFLAPPSDAFVAKINSAGSAMVWATFLGGTGTDRAQTIATDPTGNVWVSGTTNSSDFPSSSGWPYSGEFLTEFNSSGSALVYSGVFPSNFLAATLAMDGIGVVHAGGATGVVSSFAPGSAPGQTSAPRIFGVTNAAGGVLAGRVAPGEAIAIYGLHLGPTTPISATFNAAGFLPTSLGGVQVRINGISAPLLYVSDTQINAVAPVELAGGSTTLQVSQGDAPLPDFRIVTDLTAPQVFRHPDGTAFAINEDGTVNSLTNRAKVGSTISIWATGTGYFPGADGQLASGPQLFCTCEINSLIDHSSVPVPYSGAAVGMVNGVVQIKFQITSQTVGEGAYYLAVGGKYSEYFIIFFAQ